MYDLPTTITIDESEIPIRNDGDYRMVLDCFSALQDEELEGDERVLAALIIFYADLDFESVLTLSEDEMVARVESMYNFFNCGEGEVQGMKTPYKLVDWEQDAQLIVSAINKVAHKEVRAEQFVHWWTFMGYYMCVDEGAFSTIVSIRHKILKGQKLEKHEREFKNENPQYFTWNHQTVEEKEADRFIRELWNSNGKEENNG